VKFCEVVLKPRSAFGTPLKGDTIFGQFCWQAVLEDYLLNGGFERWRDLYKERPFAVFSSAFPVRREKGRREYYLPVPSCPLHFFNRISTKGNCFEVLSRLKDIKKKRWMRVSGEALRASPEKAELLNDAELYRHLFKEIAPDPVEKVTIRASQMHNTINRMTFTTGEGEFAPYPVENTWYAPGVELVVFVLFDEEATDTQRIGKGLASIGRLGFGRDVSTGLGRFDVVECTERPLPTISGSSYLYTLSPFVPAEDEAKKIWFKPFVRFGRHGNVLATSGNPFKNPVLMADEGAIVESSGGDSPYIGRALSGLSLVQKETIGQGYTIVIPCDIRLER